MPIKDASAVLTPAAGGVTLPGMNDKANHAAGLRKALTGGAAASRRRAHIRGKVRSEATALALSAGGVVQLAQTVKAAELRRLNAERKAYLATKRGNHPQPIAEFVTWGPPRHEAKDAWPAAKSKAWAVKTMAWVKRHFPDSVILDAALHMDEGSPHVHVAMFPRYKDAAGEMAYGWKRAVVAATDRLAGRPTQLNAGRQRRPGRNKAGDNLSALLDSYHAEVCADFGLIRGTRGSDREHKEITHGEAAGRHNAERAARLDTRERELDERRDLVLAAHAEQQAVAKRIEEDEAELRLERRRVSEAKANLSSRESAFARQQAATELETARAARAERALADYKHKVAPIIEAHQLRQQAVEARRKAAEAERAVEGEAVAELAEETERRPEREAPKRKRGRIIPMPRFGKPKDGDRGSREPR